MGKQFKKNKLQNHHPLVNISNIPSAASNDLWKEAISLPVFLKPRIFSPSAWTEHIPFSFWLVDSLKPGVLVELGTYYGLSYFSFCQAVQNNNLPTECFAVDNWIGDEHAGFYDNSVFEFVKKSNETYADFSTIIRSTFDEAASSFEDKSIDLLHIDGLHTYEAVKHDFYNWLPKLSERAIVIFHDTNVKENDFGVYKLWEELSGQYPSFEFKHGFGLGVLGVGNSISPALSNFFQMGEDPAAKRAIREVYERLGYLCLIEQEFIKLNSQPEASKPGMLANQSNGLSISWQPLEVLNSQIFWKKEHGEFNEADSMIHEFKLLPEKSSHIFSVEKEVGSIQKLRIDPSSKEGVFYLHSVSVTDTEGRILLDWETIRKTGIFQNLGLIKSTLVEDAFLVYSINDDPIIEIELPVVSYPTPAIGITINMVASRPENETIQKELFNTTNKTIRTASDISQLQTYFSESRQSVKSDIGDLIAKQAENILTGIKQQSDIYLQELKQNKASFLKELQDQKALFDSLIKEANQNLEKKSKIITETSEKLHKAELASSLLGEQVQQLSLNEKRLTSSYEASQKELSELETSSKKDLEQMQIHNEELNKELSARLELLEAQKLQSAVTNDLVISLKNKIRDFENSSLLAIIRSRLNKKNKPL